MTIGRRGLSRLPPRNEGNLLALAELAWTPRGLRALDDFKRRLDVQQRRLKALGVMLGP